LSALAEAFGSAFFGGPNAEASTSNRGEQTKSANEQQVKTNIQDGSFTPSIDLFSTPTSYILHTSLPGAKKPDLDITYNSTRNSITISGVITRPDVSENMMNCLIQDERREVGMFEREIKLEDGVKIDEEKIGAKLEDGVLRVIVPKITEEEEGWESVRKVELE
jgi:HSP20 family protein